MYESSTKETKWVCIQLACSRRPRAFEEAHCWNIQAKFYNEKFQLVYESDKQETLYHKDHGATLKHKYGKKDSSIALFFGPFFFWAFFWDNALWMMIITLLFIYNSMITTRYLEQDMTLYECLRRCTGIAMNQVWHVWKNYERWLCHVYYVNYMIMLSNMTMMNVSWWIEWWKVAWQYISEWLWKFHNR